ncbi:MAG: AI-2E family transporter [Anaerolineaceae bacterium]|nr:AI-2E family transporter [Anaerolineaceae bacterium]
MAQIFNDLSPKWSWVTKLVVGLSIVAAIAYLIGRFRLFMGPLILAFIITYLCYPVARFLQLRARLSWRLAVTLFYLLLIVIILGLLTLGGLSLVQQGQNLFNFVQNAILISLPNYINELATQKIVIGSFVVDFSKGSTLQDINNQILATIQPLLGQVGTLLTKVATSAATFIGWVSFILLISYFITAESGGTRKASILKEIPGLDLDVERLLSHLRNIWNTFLRGQLTIFLLAVAVYSIVLSILGLRFSLGIALLAGFARFLPYIGPFIAYLTMGLVAYFQGHTLFGLTPLVYVIVMIGISMLIDSSFDNIISPKIMSSNLKVHPAAVLVTALISANVIGFIGVVVAAPVLATIQLFGRYTIRKMFDLDPWTDIDLPPEGGMHGWLPPSMARKWEGFWVSHPWTRLPLRHPRRTESGPIKKPGPEN